MVGVIPEIPDNQKCLGCKGRLNDKTSILHGFCFVLQWPVQDNWNHGMAKEERKTTMEKMRKIRENTRKYGKYAAKEMLKRGGLK